MTDFCKIVIVDNKQCLIQIVTKEEGYGLQFTIEEQHNWLVATILNIPTIEKARKLLTETTEVTASSIVTELLDQYYHSNPPQ